MAMTSSKTCTPLWEKKKKKYNIQWSLYEVDTSGTLLVVHLIGVSAKLGYCLETKRAIFDNPLAVRSKGADCSTIHKIGFFSNSLMLLMIFRLTDDPTLDMDPPN